MSSAPASDKAGPSLLARYKMTAASDDPSLFLSELDGDDYAGRADDIDDDGGEESDDTEQMLQPYRSEIENEKWDGDLSSSESTLGDYLDSFSEQSSDSDYSNSSASASADDEKSQAENLISTSFLLPEGNPNLPKNAPAEIQDVFEMIKAEVRAAQTPPPLLTP